MTIVDQSHIYHSSFIKTNFNENRLNNMLGIENEEDIIDACMGG